MEVTSISKSLKERLQSLILTDGYDVELNLEKSKGSYLWDNKRDQAFLDMGSFYASMPLGMNTEALTSSEAEAELLLASKNKIANGDFYTEHYASFLETFQEIAVPKHFSHAFFISGGALAVENALKASFDWKVRKNFAKGVENVIGSQFIHFTQAFHGRSGYTLSLTNTADPRKYQYFPRFNWPRIDTPKITYPLEDHLEEVKAREEKAEKQILEAIATHGHDVAGIIIEPIQGEGGDNHFRPEFLRLLRKIADENEVILAYDEVQTGVGITGEWWAHQHVPGAEPDVMAFAKKMQVGGILASKRFDEVEKNVFAESSRISSTWGGNIVDLVRSKYHLKYIDQHNLLENVQKQGKFLMHGLYELQEKGLITNVRGKGLFVAFDLKSTEMRNSLKDELFRQGMIILGCGTHSLRFRPPLNVHQDDLSKALTILESAIKAT